MPPGTPTCDRFGATATSRIQSALGSIPTAPARWRQCNPGRPTNDGDNPYADFDGSGSLTSRYLYGPALDALMARMHASGNVVWYLGDMLGSVRLVVTTSGGIQDQISYFAFGGIASETNPANGDRFKFTGREFDATLGIYNYRNRWFDAGTGRFLSEDPTKFQAGDPNFYRYVHSVPTSGTDPTGLDQSGMWGGLIAGTGFGVGTGLWVGLKFGSRFGIGGVIAGALGGLLVGGLFGGFVGSRFEGFWAGLGAGVPAGVLGGLVGGFIGVYVYAVLIRPLISSKPPVSKPIPPDELNGIAVKELREAIRQAHRDHLNPKHIEEMMVQLAKLLRELGM